MKKLILTALLFCFAGATYSQYGEKIRMEKLLATDTTSVGQKIIYPNFTNPEISYYRITLPKGCSTGWHQHSFPVFAYIEQGTLTVEFENKGVKTFSKGDAFAEVIDLPHNGYNSGNEDVVLLAIFMGEKGKSLSTHK